MIALYQRINDNSFLFIVISGFSMRFLKVIIPVLVLAGTFLLAKYLLATGPKAKKKPFVKSLPIVEVVALKEQNYTVVIDASGIVRAGTQTNLVAEVSGKITEISNKFLEGNYFTSNKILLRIEDFGYKNAVAIAESDVASNRASLVQLLEEEKSLQRSIQLSQTNLNYGKKEAHRKRGLWQKKLISRSSLDVEEQKLNQLQQKKQELQGRLNAFNSRKLALKAKINASLSRLNQEKLKLSKTIIKAPYAGRVFNKSVDVGQFVGVGTVLGKIYATDFVYVDLPLSLSKYELLDIPEQFQGQRVKGNLPSVSFSNATQKTKNTWQGKVVRSSAALDSDSRQIKLIAKIENPFKAGNGASAPIKIGQYLNAKITGKNFNKVFILPPVAVRQNKEIMLLENQQVHIVPVDVLWNSVKETVVRTQEEIAGKMMITTVMSQAVEGMKVVTVKEQRKIESEKAKKKSANFDNKNKEADSEKPKDFLVWLKGLINNKSEAQTNTKKDQLIKSPQGDH